MINTMRILAILSYVSTVLSTTTGSDFHLQCLNNGDVYVEMPYSGRKPVKVTHLFYGDCDETSSAVVISYTGAIETDDYAVHLTMNRQKCNMTNWEEQDAVVRLGSPERNIYIAEYTIDSYCEHDDEFEVEFGYGSSLNHYEYNESGGSVNCSFELVPYDEQFENEISDPPERAGEMIHLALREKCDFEHCSKVYAPKQCSVTDGIIEYEVYNYETRCTDEPIEFAMEYDPMSHIWQIQYIIFLMGDRVESMYKLTCTIVVCDKLSASSECVRIMDTCHNGIEDLHDPRCDDPCESDPCQNNSTCKATSDGSDYSCTDCSSELTGKNCDTELSPDPCSQQPCQNNANCVPNSDKSDYSCVSCSSEFTGKNCDTEVVNPCDLFPSDPCKNGGMCVNNGDVQGCQCAAGYTGELCETELSDPCKDNFCQNGGNCVNNATFQGCECPACFTGELCNTDLCPNPCSDDPCKNNATCEATADKTDYSCTNCKSDFTGKDCDTEVNPCDLLPSDPCKNGGVCVNNGNVQGCQCPEGYTGELCQTEIVDPCAENLCQNGGKCVNNATFQGCECTTCFVGELCDTELCQNDATCEDLGNEEYFCRCPTTGETLYTGENCDIPLYSDGAGAYGDVHFTTYDQGHLNNQGLCNYYYTKLCDKSDPTIPDFYVVGIQGLHDRDSGTWGVSYVRGMTFMMTPVGSTQRRRFTIHNDFDAIKYYENAADQENVRPVQTNENFADSGIAVRSYGDEMVIYWGVGWDFKSTSWLDSSRTKITDYLGMVTFTRWEKELKEKNGRFYGGWVMRIDSVLNAALRNKVCGLWGNYNDVQEVDIDVPAGGGKNKKHAFWNTVGDLYQTVPSKSCDHIGTECDPAKRTQYLAECQKLHDSPFSKCDLDREQLIDDCVFDLCVIDPDGDTELTVCSMMETYVKRCNQKKKKTVTNWRNNNRCSRNCPTNAVYRACGKPECYPVIGSTNSDGCDVSGCDASTSCVEGCYCKDGYYQYGSGSKMKCYEEKLIIWTSALNCAAPICTKDERRQPSQPAEECFGSASWDHRDVSLGDWGEPLTSVRPSDGVDQENGNDAYCDVTYTNENFCMPHSYTERVSYVIHRKNGGMTYSEAKHACTSAGAEMAEIKTNRDRNNLRTLYLAEAASKNSKGIRMWVGGQWATSGGPHELPNDANERDFGNLLRFSYPSGNPVCYNNFADYSGYKYYYPAADAADGGFGGLGLGRCLMVGAMFENGKYRETMEWTPEKCSYKANYVACQFRCFHNNDQNWHEG